LDLLDDRVWEQFLIPSNNAKSIKRKKKINYKLERGGKKKNKIQMTPTE
jgi:hypothetical protein